MPTHIAAFEVPPASDAAFRSAFDTPGALYRALRDDVALRYVCVASEPPPSVPPIPAHAAVYDVVHEDGDPDGAGGAVLITPFAGGDEELTARWLVLRGLFAGRQGYLGSRLYRSTGPADFRHVALVRWSSPLMYARTLRQAGVGPAMAELPAEPALYLVA
jgi:hypothetical protein